MINPEDKDLREVWAWLDKHFDTGLLSDKDMENFEQLINSRILEALEDVDRNVNELQTYKLQEGAEDILVERSDVMKAPQEEKKRYGGRDD